MTSSTSITVDDSAFVLFFTLVPYFLLLCLCNQTSWCTLHFLNLLPSALASLFAVIVVSDLSQLLRQFVIHGPIHPHLSLLWLILHLRAIPIFTHEKALQQKTPLALLSAPHGFSSVQPNSHDGVDTGPLPKTTSFSASAPSTLLRPGNLPSLNLVGIVNQRNP